MTNVQPPTGHDVYWEKWRDAFEVAEEKFSELLEEMQSQDDDMFATSSYGEDQDDDELGADAQYMPHVRSVMTPYGLLPLTDDTLASKQFKFWTGHSNFRLTEEYFSVIGTVAGVETLDILTPYRFRIGIGKLFTDRSVMHAVRSGMLEHLKNEDDTD
tara:strand:- start:643 stop:1116 length:474 start_codon:yes stop_codon:yes gene_type:complete